MDELVKAMSNEQLEALKEQHKDNESIAKLVDGILEARAKEAVQSQAKIEFGKGVEKLVAKLATPPDGVYNVYVAYREVEEEDRSQEAVMVKAEGSEYRYPTVKVRKWVVEVNKAIQVGGKGSASTSPTNGSKRSVTIERREGSQIVLVGHFPSASKACEYLSLNPGGDSATRFLQREGYLISPYTGTDFTS